MCLPAEQHYTGLCLQIKDKLSGQIVSFHTVQTRDMQLLSMAKYTAADTTTGTI